MYEYVNCVLLHRYWNQEMHLLTPTTGQNQFFPVLVNYLYQLYLSIFNQASTECQWSSTGSGQVVLQPHVVQVFCNYIFEAFKAHSQVDVISLISAKLLTVLIIIYCYVSWKQLVSANLFYRGFVLLLMIGNNFLKFMESLLTYFPFPLVSLKVAATSLLSFFVFLNSISSRLKHARFLAFADLIDSQNECFVLQDELNNIIEWANKLGLDFNIVKGYILYDLNTSYSVNGTT